jgi:hypothetical protein
MVELCKNRIVLFDNMSKDPRVEAKQVEKLIDVVDSVCANNGGKPFSDQMLTRIKVNYSFLLFFMWSVGSYLCILYYVGGA